MFQSIKKHLSNYFTGVTLLRDSANPCLTPKVYLSDAGYAQDPQHIDDWQNLGIGLIINATSEDPADDELQQIYRDIGIQYLWVPIRDTTYNAVPDGYLSEILNYVEAWTRTSTSNAPTIDPSTGCPGRNPPASRRLQTGCPGRNPPASRRLQTGCPGPNPPASRRLETGLEFTTHWLTSLAPVVDEVNRRATCYENVLDIWDYLGTCVEKNPNILIHCSAGVNRSALVAAAILWYTTPNRENIWATPEELIDYMRQRQVEDRGTYLLINPSFYNYLMEFLK